MKIKSLSLSFHIDLTCSARALRFNICRPKPSATARPSYLFTLLIKIPSFQWEEVLSSAAAGKPRCPAWRVWGERAAKFRVATPGTFRKKRTLNDVDFRDGGGGGGAVDRKKSDWWPWAAVVIGPHWTSDIRYVR